MKIGIIGAGRLGICFALLCEAAGYDVVVSDIREDYVNGLNDRKIVTTEPEVENLLKVAKNFKATTNNKELISECDIIYTLVATPSYDNGNYDVTAIDAVVNDVLESDNISNKSFIVGCTTNPGDCERWAKKLNSHNVSVYYNPEFIAQGSIISDLRSADMVLLGCDLTQDSDIIEQITELYKKIQRSRVIVCTMTTKSAEITKIAINCFLTTKISYANMLGDVLHLAGCGDEVANVLSAIGIDNRIGRKYLNWGVGYGGPCLPRDNRAFAAFANDVGIEYNLGLVVDSINEEHSKFVCDYWEKMNSKNLPFYFDYITYKKGTDILTESQQFRLCTDLLDRGHHVYVHNDSRVTLKINDELISKYGDRVKFVDRIENITEPIFIVSL